MSFKYKLKWPQLESSVFRSVLFPEHAEHSDSAVPGTRFFSFQHSSFEMHYVPKDLKNGMKFKICLKLFYRNWHHHEEEYSLKNSKFRWRISSLIPIRIVPEQKNTGTLLFGLAYLNNSDEIKICIKIEIQTCI